MNRADRRAKGCRGGKHALRKNVPDQDGRILTICAACGKVIGQDGGA